jgi:phage shock protein C
MNQTDLEETANYKKLYVSTVNRKIAGVCGGIAEYFEIDPTVVRLGWVILTLTTGIVPGIVAYVAAIIMMPKAHTAREVSALKAKHA